MILDAIREVRKYANEVAIEASIRHTADSENVVHMRLFRAQRNLYISGFALLLFLFVYLGNSIPKHVMISFQKH